MLFGLFVVDVSGCGRRGAGLRQWRQNRCPPDECCDNGTCVSECTNTGQCDYGELPDGPYVQCIDDPVTGKCGFLEGGLCNHLVTIAQNDARCADCAPGCNKTRVSACAEITPVYCKEERFLLVFTCLCVQGGPYEYRGDHYECN